MPHFYGAISYQAWGDSMRTTFPGHFRPTESEFEILWKNCTFAVDANVILNLYRYSPETRQALESTLKSVAERLFLPHQAGKEFLKNRLGVTAGQADEYRKIAEKLNDLATTLSNRKKHPFLHGDELQSFLHLVPNLLQQIESQRAELLSRLTNDEVLEAVESLFSERTGAPFDDTELKAITAEGDLRYQNEVPPGYKDGKKDASGDPYRKYGDLIVWKQLIQHAKSTSLPIIFVTDDKKEDWWLEQSGRTIGPRTELRDEFIKETSTDFWMYTADRFMEESARINNTTVDQEAIAEIKEISEDVKVEATQDQSQTSELRDKIIHPVLSEKEIFGELSEFLESHSSEDEAVGLKYFVSTYLGNQNYEINHSYARINALADRGLVEIFKRNRNGITSTRVRIPKNDADSF